jgi:nitrite reductase/ring-hydroxylating ferredoxin subunit
MTDAGGFELCRVEEIPDGFARGFALPGQRRGVFAVRRGQQVHVYVNRCPHAGAELEYAKDRFLSFDRERIVCFAHGAHFAIETGACIAGPCAGQRLKRVPARIVEGCVLIDWPGDHDDRATHIEG